MHLVPDLPNHLELIQVLSYTASALLSVVLKIIKQQHIRPKTNKLQCKLSTHSWMPLGEFYLLSFLQRQNKANTS